MKNKIFYIVFFLSSCAKTYDLRFNKKVEQTNFKYSEKEIESSTVGTLNDMNFDTELLKGITLYEINNYKRRKKHPTLEFDSLYTQIAQNLINDYKTTNFLKSSAYYRKKKSVKNIVQIQGHSHKVSSVHAFYIDILNLPYGDKFHYTILDGTSKIHLYKGKKPTKKDKEKEGYQEPEPLGLCDGKLFGERVMDLFLGQLGQDMNNKNFSVLGIAYKLDKRSMYRYKRPKVFGIIIFGGKKMQDVKIPPLIKAEKEQAN